MKILIRLPNWLGDVVMSTAFITAVKEFYPTATIDAIIKAELAEIAMFIPKISTVYSFSKQQYSGLGGVYRFGKSLRAEKYDLFFNLPTSLSSAVLAYATGIKKRIGFKKEGGFFMLTNSFKKPANIHRVDEYLFLLEQLTGNTIQDRKVQLSIDAPPEKDKNRVLVNFNSEASSRRMPLEKGAAIINLLTNTFPNTLFTFVGSSKEAVFISQLIEKVQNRSRVEDLAGKTNLVGLCNLIAGATAVLTTDSGPAHIANSLGTPTMVLFGAGNELNTAPYNKMNLNILRYGQLNCEPCVRNTCKLYGIPKCMQLMDELKIIAALRVYLPNA